MHARMQRERALLPGRGGSPCMHTTPVARAMHGRHPLLVPARCAGSTTAILANGKQLGDVIKTNKPHGSITFTGGSKYVYTGTSTTTRAMTTTLEMMDQS